MDAFGFALGVGVRQRLPVASAPPPWTPAALGAALLEWLDPTQAGTITGSPVEAVASPAARLSEFRQQDPVKRPSLTSERLVFDGADDYLVQAASSPAGTVTTLPDIASSDPGKGPTCTGLARDPDGTWWVGDHGAATGATITDAGLIHYNADFSAVLGRIRLADLGIGQNSVQGVAYDTSDDTLWFVVLNTGLIYHVSKAGALLGSITPASTASPNGLAYDSINDQLIVAQTAGPARWINKATGASVKTVNIFTDAGNGDMLFFDASEGGSGALYLSYGRSGDQGRVTKYDAASGAALKHWVLPSVLAIEGIVVHAGTLYVCDDAYYHGGASDVNAVRRFAIDPASPAYGTRLILAGVGKIAATPSATKALWVSGDPVVTRGAGLYFPNAANMFRLFVNTSGTASILNWTVTVTTEFIWYCDIDTAGGTAALYVNGTLVSSQALSAAGSIPHGAWMLAGNFEGQSALRNSAATVGGALAATNATERERIEGFLAWQTGTEALLPAEHPYRGSAP